MDLPLMLCFTLILNLAISVPFSKGATFTFVNKCEYTVWPGILANAGTPSLESTGFELPSSSSRSLQAPSGWSGRFWGRTSCQFGSSSTSCLTGDCGSGSEECNGAGAAPPVTLAEFTLGAGSLDFYDVSLVDGYNLPMLVEPLTGSTGSASSCAATGCLSDLNRTCPMELRSENGEACKSACEAFGSPEYCCSGEYGSPATCKPSVYSQMFKSACPRSYSYAYDDATSTFTCSGADYAITFCPSSPSQKSTTPATTTPVTTATPTTTTTTTPDPSLGSGPGSEFGAGSMSFEGSSSTTGGGYQSGYPGTETGATQTGSQTSTAMLTDGSWLAGLAMGNAARSYFPSILLSLLANLSILLCLVYLS